MIQSKSIGQKNYQINDSVCFTVPQAKLLIGINEEKKRLYEVNEAITKSHILQSIKVKELGKQLKNKDVLITEQQEALVDISDELVRSKQREVILSKKAEKLKKESFTRGIIIVLLLASNLYFIGN